MLDVLLTGLVEEVDDSVGTLVWPYVDGYVVPGGVVSDVEVLPMGVLQDVPTETVPDPVEAAALEPYVEGVGEVPYEVVLVTELLDCSDPVIGLLEETEVPAEDVEEVSLVPGPYVELVPGPYVVLVPGT